MSEQDPEPVKPHFDPHARLQTKEGICEWLGHISPSTYDLWQRRGIVPGPVSGTTRYDVKQHALVLDMQAGLERYEAAHRLSPYEKWSREYEAARAEHQAAIKAKGY